MLQLIHKDAGASAFEINAHITLMSDRRNEKQSSGAGTLPENPNEDADEEGSNPDEEPNEPEQGRRTKAAEDAAWAAIFEQASNGRFVDSSRSRVRANRSGQCCAGQ